MQRNRLSIKLYEDCNLCFLGRIYVSPDPELSNTSELTQDKVLLRNKQSNPRPTGGSVVTC